MGEKVTFVSWWWKPPGPYRSEFKAEHVRTLRNMLSRHFHKDADFVCVTDSPEALDPDITAIRLWDQFGDLPSPHGARNPSCYRRLRLFAPDAAQVFGGTRLASVDLDSVVVRDVTPVFDRPEPFLIFGKTDARNDYNGSFILLTAGARRQVWDVFSKNPSAAIADAKRNQRFGSDQAIITNVLGPNETIWTQADGVYSFRVHLENGNKPLPANARLISMHGGTDPWSSRGQGFDWIRRHYQ